MLFIGEIEQEHNTENTTDITRSTNPELLVKYGNIWSKVSDFQFLTKYC